MDVDSESGVLTVSGERKHEMEEEKSDGDDGKRKSVSTADMSWGMGFETCPLIYCPAPLCTLGAWP